MNRFFPAACLAAFCLYAYQVEAQAVYAASERVQIRAGAGGMYLDTDYGERRNNGVAFWADCDFLRFLGLEAEGRLGGLVAPGDVGENSYLIGPRVIYRRRRFSGYGRAMAGRGTISNQRYNLSSSFNLYSLGGGVEYKVSRRWYVRAFDFELQRWPDFKPSVLSPIVITAGASYVIR